MNKRRFFYAPSMASRSAFGIRCAFPPEIKATRTRAVTKRSCPRLHSCSRMIDAPLTSSGTVITSSRSSNIAGFTKSILIERTTKAKRGTSLRASFRKLLLIHSEQTQVICSAAFHEAQKTGVINNLAGVSVFEINADAHLMTTVANFAFKRACHRKIPPIALREHAPCSRQKSNEVLGVNKNSLNLTLRYVVGLKNVDKSPPQARRLLIGNSHLTATPREHREIHAFERMKRGGPRDAFGQRRFREPASLRLVAGRNRSESRQIEDLTKPRGLVVVRRGSKSVRGSGWGGRPPVNRSRLCG